jgi:hypothetical protein
MEWPDTFLDEVKGLLPLSPRKNVTRDTIRHLVEGIAMKAYYEGDGLPERIGHDLPSHYGNQVYEALKQAGLGKYADFPTLYPAIRHMLDHFRERAEQIHYWVYELEMAKMNEGFQEPERKAS